MIYFCYLKWIRLRNDKEEKESEENYEKRDE